MKRLLGLVLCFLLLTGCGVQRILPVSEADPSSSSSESEAVRDESSESSSSTIMTPPAVSSESSSEDSSSSESDVSSSESESASETSSSSETSASSSSEAPVATPEPTKAPTSTPAPSSSSSGVPSLGGGTDSEEASASASTPAATSAPAAVSGNTSSIESEIIRLTNQIRKNLGLGTLTLNYDLQKAARIRATEFAVYDLDSHIRPDGRSWETVLKSDVPVAFRYAAENMAGARTNQANFTGLTAQDYVDMWVNSPSHYAAMTDSRYTNIGVGVYQDVDENGLWRCYSVTLFCAFS